MKSSILYIVVACSFGLVACMADPAPGGNLTLSWNVDTICRGAGVDAFEVRAAIGSNDVVLGSFDCYAGEASLAVPIGTGTADVTEIAYQLSDPGERVLRSAVYVVEVGATEDVTLDLALLH